MRRYWLFSISLLVLMLAIFAGLYFLGFESLTGENAPDVMSTRSISAALIGIALLISDIVLPVPSSAVMIANGVLFGIVVGAVLSMIGNLGAGIIGFWLGRRGGPLLDRFVPKEEQEKANNMLKRWGPFAIIASRPLPMIAETTVLMAGSSKMKWSTLLWSTFLGSVPHVILFAVTGATAATFDNLLWAFGFSVLIGGVVLVVGLFVQNHQDEDNAEDFIDSELNLS